MLGALTNLPGELLRLVPAVQELWNALEIHCLILVSLFLQVFLFLTADMRRRSRGFSKILWLAYLLADTVAIFVLGHLAVHASGPRHQLMFFWAPFVLVHLGGQDTITAFSKQDNELWMRHLLSLVSQVAAALYVVVKASWPDHRLRAAMVIMFLSGCCKYAERTYCLFIASPASRRFFALNRLSSFTRAIKQKPESAREFMTETLDMMSKGNPIRLNRNLLEFDILDILTLDAPLNSVQTILDAHELPGMLAKFKSSANHCRAYEFVEACLAHCYGRLYTKFLIRSIPWRAYFPRPLRIVTLLYMLLQCTSALIALVLFTVAEKGGQLHTTSRADITVSYILLIGATVLDVFSAIMLFFPCIQHACCRKQWSEELGQYSMVRRHAVQDTSGMLPACIRLFIQNNIIHTAIPITKDRTPIKEFILDSLLSSGTRKEWNIASTRGQLALRKWRHIHQEGTNSARRPRNALEESISSGVDFPTSVLIWHIATDICYYYRDKANNNSDQMSKHKKMSRELSNYIMYLVFECGVMLTNNSQFVHRKTDGEIRDVLMSDQQHKHVILGEKDAVRKIFEATKVEDLANELQDSAVIEELANEQQDSTVIEIQKHEEPDENDDNAADGHVQKLLQSAQALDSPVLPRACKVAHGLISINDETERWDLIAAVWSEMLYYTAPRCGGAFHYEHLSTGGEFITHVLLLMYFLGPFMPIRRA